MSTFFSKSLWRLLLVVLLLSAARPLFAQAPTWQDATSPGVGITFSTAVDAAGNAYMTGCFSGTATFGAITLTSDGGSNDMFVAKRSPAGAWLWATSVGGIEGEVGYGVAVDGSGGGVVVTGSFGSPTLTFGTTTLTNEGQEDLFVAKLTPMGTWEWATSAGGDVDEIGRRVAVDGSGNVVITGCFRSPTLTFGATTLTNEGQEDLFVAKLTPMGTWEWATSAGGMGLEYGNDVAVDGSGSVVIIGYFSTPTLTFGAITLTSTFAFGEKALFVAKLSPTGTWQWVTSAAGYCASTDFYNSVAVDGSGNVVVAGTFSSRTLTFSTTTLTNAGGDDLFVAKLTPTGVWQWATGAGGGFRESGRSVAVDGSGSVVVTGYFRSPTITFGTTTLTNAGAEDLFVAKLTPTGAWQWATSAGGSFNDSGHDVAVDGSGSVVVTGYFCSPTITFGATTLSNPNPGAVSTANFFARLGSTTGLFEESTQPVFTLAPNPSRTSVQLTGATGPTATLLDGLGRPVGTAAVTQGAATLDVHALPAGLYLLRAGAATQRLVVE